MGVAFVRTDGELYIASFRGSQPIPPGEWIEVASGITQPAWSPDGLSIYFRPVDQLGASEPLLMRQVLDRGTRRPAGPPTVFVRFDGMSFSGAIANPIAVARDQIVLMLGEPASDLCKKSPPANAGG